MSFHPQTPQSPSQFSPSTSDMTTSQTTSSMTPITTNTLPTPAHSVNGSSIPSEMAHDIAMGEDSPHNKRKRPVDDQGDREQKKVQIEDRRLGIESLHLDVGEKYLLCRTPCPPSRPDISEDLFERYGLTDLAREVARVLPNGEKNAIRKTYKGHIKKLGVQGHFDSVNKDENDPTSMLSLMKYPMEEWTVHYVRGRDILDGFTPETQARLPKATAMLKGLVPRSLWDSSVLGDIGPGKGEKQSSSARPTAPNTPLTTGVGLPRAKTQTPSAAVQDNRPKRNVKKRGYGDSSFEGYGEGYPDDDGGAETGYSTGEGDMALSQKRRKKVLINS
ncbi:Rox3 mediator complex subunit-domain-containing protein [Bombardia bombarda]|uniref:Mediator of RNA polymerase II transcription subunit 19 n=1 Tax=Bombardia bombarda TaxID=252184 RepID=A0AA39XLC2_9PEZI|nr:Rox3 mediator complex subunit-domain-containing protein [Bombardia bombarda]